MKTTSPMSKLLPNFLISGCILALSTLSYSQDNSVNGTWKSVNESSIPIQGTRLIKPSNYLTLKLDLGFLQQQLNAVKRINDPSYIPIFISLPKPNGTYGIYEVYENETMSIGLAQQFPEIRSFDGIATNNSGEIVKFDLTPQGFHAMTLIPGKPTTFIDPYSFGGGDIQHYICYSKDNFNSDKLMECEVTTLLPTEYTKQTEVQVKSYGNCTKRTYRLALSATGEYTAFHGGTVVLAQAAQVTTMNRVNGVYMRDFAVTMTIIPNNSLIIYTNAGTDPFTNGNPGSMITENQNNTTTVIGAANYDVGHVFGTNSGGLAGLGVVCSNSNKARGVTGSSAPIGDPFDIDYVAHELGHQFSGNHSFRGNAGACSGNANGATAMEPGSGSSIMAYAGICNPQNVQANSDDHFHGVNMKEMHTFITTGNGNNCPVSTAIPNQSAPIITFQSPNVTIPISTPFALTVIATDDDGDVLTYCWEQMNNQNSPQPPLATSTNGPNFRSRTPQTSGTRYFPSIASQLAGGPFTWEVLPSISRTMNFRCIVRDNEVGGGCNDDADVILTTTESAGPFIVLYPSTSGITWAGGSTQTVTWDVANTNNAPVSCANVDIMLSIDGGLTFTVIANDVLNDGSQEVVVPNIASTSALIIVMCENGTFFDVSNNVFTITGVPCNAPEIPTISGSTSFCVGGSTDLSISSGNLNDANDWQWTSTSCGGTVVGTGTTVNISTPGTYFVRGFGGCVTSGPCQTINIAQTSINATVQVNSGSLSSNQVGAEYLWLDCNNSNAPISGATSQTFSPTVNGSYAVQVTMNGCVSTSSCASYNSAGLEELDFNVSLYPNPTSGKVMLSFDTERTIENMNVTDLAGRLVNSKQSFTAQQIELDLNSEAAGIYFLTFKIVGINKTYRIVKQ